MIVINEKKEPVTCIIGGSKISTKINVISNLIKNVNNIVIVGAMANNFLQYKSKQIGKSLIITRGEYGSIAIIKGEVVECNSKKNLKIRDLTGAGDLFAAGFLHGQINNLSTKECLEKGTEMSSKIIQKIGARLN